MFFSSFSHRPLPPLIKTLVFAQLLFMQELASLLQFLFKGSLAGFVLSNPIVQVPLARLVGCIPISICGVIELLIKMIDEYPGSVGSEER